MHVLLVDDDELDRYTLRRALVSAKFEATLIEVETAEDALSLLAAKTYDFQCAIFDLHLPGQDGWDLLREVRLRGHHLPVIFLTGQGSEQLAVDLMKAGAADYLPKSSLTPSRLVQCLQQAVQLSLANQLRQRAEQELRRSELSYRTLTEHLPDVVVRFDREHRHLYANRPPLWAPELPIQQLIGTRLEDICPPHLKQTLLTALLRASKGETVEIRLAQPVDKHTHHYLLRFVPERLSETERNHLSGTVLALVQDVTSEVERAEELERSRYFERQLIGIVSHDLRNPISAVLMCAGLLRRETEDITGERTQRLIDVLETSAQRATRLVTDILDFTKARLGGGIPIVLSPNNLGDVCTQILGEVRATHPERQIELVTEGDLQGGFDGERIGQALANLLLNAIIHGDGSTPIVVCASGEPNHLNLSVQNSGITLSQDTIIELFEPYHRGKDVKNKNLGLGLFIVKHILEAHHGNVTVSSESNCTMFHLRFPRGPNNLMDF